MDHSLSVLQQFREIPLPISNKNQDMLQWFKKLHSIFLPEKPLPDWIRDIKSLNNFLGTEVEPTGNISRGNFALLIDKIIDPFHIWPIDLNGHFLLN